MRRLALLLALLLAACIPEPLPAPIALPPLPPQRPLILTQPEPKGGVAHKPVSNRRYKATAPADKAGAAPLTPAPIVAPFQNPPAERDAGLPPTSIPPLASEPDPMLVPVAARPYQRQMIREGRMVWGMSAPIALAGAQIQTESAWHPNAHSAYAAGLSQFIPSTANAMAAKYPDLGPQAQPLNPGWAIRALYRYDHDIYSGRFVNAVPPATECDKWAFVLSGYNGGEGWISRDRALCAQESGCDTSRWYGHVERHTSRSVSNAQQNREYPRRIEKQYQGAYRSWGGYVQCSA